MIKKRAERNLLAVIVELSFGWKHLPVFTVFLSESETMSSRQPSKLFCSFRESQLKHVESTQRHGHWSIALVGTAAVD
jgi:hypothetical protein